MKTINLKKYKELVYGKYIIIFSACITLFFPRVNAQVNPGYNVSAATGPISLTVPDNSLTGRSIPLTLSGAGVATIDATSVLSVTVSVNTTFNSDIDMYLVGPSGCGTLELSTDNGSSGHNYAAAVLVSPGGATNINTLNVPTNNISGIWRAEGSYDVASGQNLLFDFNNAPLYTSLPISQTVNGVTASFTATGQGYSIQNANTMGFTPPGFSGRCIYPNSIYLSDLLISFDHTLTKFSILYSCQELGCDDAATMRVTAKMNGTVVGTNTRTATNPGTWPVDTLSCNFPQGFNSVVIHYNSPPPTCQDYGVIFLADDMRITALNNPSPLASGTGGASYSLPLTAISGCPVNGTWSLFVGDDAPGNNATVTSFALNIMNIVPATMNLNLFIEGFYIGSGQMYPSLFANGLSSDPSACDSITVEFHNTSFPYSTFTSVNALLLTDGSTQIQLPNSVLNNNYFIVIRHRNAIETWSAGPVLMNNGVTYNFTTAPIKAYGSNMIDIGTQFAETPTWAFYSGDISDTYAGLGFQDGIIESMDYSDMENAVYYTTLGYVPEDITGDGVVESMDYSLMENNIYYTIISMHP